MNVAEFEMQLAAARGAREGGMEIERFVPFDLHPATADELAHAERALDVELPDQYKDFMMRHGGGMFLFVDLLPIKSSDAPEDLLSRNTGEWHTPDFVAISPVGTGDWWGFIVNNGRCFPGVYFWRHDDDDRELTYDDFYTFLANQGLKAA